VKIFEVGHKVSLQEIRRLLTAPPQSKIESPNLDKEQIDRLLSIVRPQKTALSDNRSLNLPLGEQDVELALTNEGVIERLRASVSPCCARSTSLIVSVRKA
jgi:hypothetical protein